MDWNSNPIYKPIDCNDKCTGVYRVRLFKEGTSYPINRFNGEDLEGVLSIGMSNNLNKRRDQFFRIVYGNTRRGHSEAITWWLVRNVSNFQEESCSLKFDYRIMKNDTEARMEEKRLIQEYFIKFSEPPPLNAVIPKRTEWYKDERK